ncbi:Uma2 family endonuclease, partial [Nostoc sp.]|uniref:Uma2 family endonuclease n=1 Tax=Nostoc sp. TaxID=1180 RepID=UPI002FF8A4EF
RIMELLLDGCLRKSQLQDQHCLTYLLFPDNSMDAKVRLGWLIDRKTRRVEIYRQGQPKEVLESPTSLSEEDILPGFVLDLRIVWG